MRRRLAAVAAFALAVGTLTACTPAPEPIVALAVHGGRPIAVLVTCGGGSAGISVYENDKPIPTATPGSGEPDGTPTMGRHVSWSVHGDPTTEIVEVELLGPPPHGWTTEKPHVVIGLPTPGAFEVVPLAALQPGVRYSLVGSSRRYAVDVDFTTADFDRIGPDQVLAPDDGVTVLMPRAEFEENARETCER
ncbi:hypothetical protein [Catellatospora sichuanensis]|uniref:hypothetical protein n=1 Tax=Catellatospora sichuanensis TaxID=1969805 RepID=UPI001182297F|nr:hypothetical protein [Catellatospora sichuanensis]